VPSVRVCGNRGGVQDIAVDGWALTLLSRRHVGYASTCQTVGMNMGYFTSITVFLALNDASFCNRFLRAANAAAPLGLVSLTSYMRFWAFAYAIVTLAVWLLKAERPAACAPSAANLHPAHTLCTGSMHAGCMWPPQTGSAAAGMSRAANRTCQASCQHTRSSGAW
jgi:hypothetical protein